MTYRKKLSTWLLHGTPRSLNEILWTRYSHVRANPKIPWSCSINRLCIACIRQASSYSYGKSVIFLFFFLWLFYPRRKIFSWAFRVEVRLIKVSVWQIRTLWLCWLYLVRRDTFGRVDLRSCKEEFFFILWRFLDKYLVKDIPLGNRLI